MRYGYSAKFTAQPGKRDELVEILLGAAGALEGNPECLQYLVSITDEPEAIWVHEIWTSEQAHDASLDPEEVRATIQRARPLIASVSSQVKRQVVGGKGLS